MAVQIYVPGVVQLVESVGLFLLVSGKLCSILGLGLMPYPGMVDVRPCPFGTDAPLRPFRSVALLPVLVAVTSGTVRRVAMVISCTAGSCCCGLSSDRPVGSLTARKAGLPREGGRSQRGMARGGA